MAGFKYRSAGSQADTEDISIAMAWVNLYLALSRRTHQGKLIVPLSTLLLCLSIRPTVGGLAEGPPKDGQSGYLLNQEPEEA